MNKSIIWIALLISMFPVVVYAIGFGGYYTMSFPAEDYSGRDISDIDFENSFLGFCGKGWYDINQNLAVEAAGSFNQYPTEPVTQTQGYPGGFVPENLTLWSAEIGCRFGLPVKLFTPYVSAGAGLYHVSVTESRFDPVEIHFSKSYPGIYIGGGTKVKLFGPVSFDISPTYSYVMGTGGEGDRVSRLSAFDVNIGLAVDL